MANKWALCADTGISHTLGNILGESRVISLEEITHDVVIVGAIANPSAMESRAVQEMVLVQYDVIWISIEGGKWQLDIASLCCCIHVEN